MGMDPAVSALLWGLGSAMSLPLGAGVAIMPWIPDPSERVIGLMMSFGAGALLFAVSVRLIFYTILPYPDRLRWPPLYHDHRVVERVICRAGHTILLVYQVFDNRAIQSAD